LDSHDSSLYPRVRSRREAKAGAQKVFALKLELKVAREKAVNLTTLHNPIRGGAQPGSIIVAVGGGKGGVGKSFLSSNLGIFLANMGFNTVIIDCDLGAPNLHTCLGEPPPKLNFHDYLCGKVDSIIETAVATQFPKLRLISGSNDHQELANISVQDQSRLMSAIYNIDADFTILDLSAGTHTSTLDFFLMAEQHIVTLTPDPTSIENAYRFMRATFFRKIKRFERQLQLDSVVAGLMQNAQENEIRVPSDLFAQVIRAEPQKGQELRNIMRRLSFDIVINQTRSSKDVQVGQSIAAVSKKYFGVNTTMLGYLEYDNAVWHALRKRRPLILEFPHSALYSQILGIARDLSSPHLKKAVI
jgi:flagellar biosynthesis protein FlhG